MSAQPELFDILLARATKYFSGVDRVYVLGCYCGVNEKTCLTCASSRSWRGSNHFAVSMFIHSQFKDVTSLGPISRSSMRATS